MMMMMQSTGRVLINKGAPVVWLLSLAAAVGPVLPRHHSHHPENLAAAGFSPKVLSGAVAPLPLVVQYVSVYF